MTNNDDYNNRAVKEALILLTIRNGGRLVIPKEEYPAAGASYTLDLTFDEQGCTVTATIEEKEVS